MPSVTDSDRPCRARSRRSSTSPRRTPGAAARRGRVCATRTRSSAGPCTRRRCTRGRRGWRASAAPCCDSTSAASAAAQATFDEGEGEKADFHGGARLHGRARIPGSPLWAAGFSFGAWVALDVGAATIASRALIGIAPPVATRYDFSVERRRSARSRNSSCRARRDEICPIQDMWTFYGSCRAERAGRDRRGRSPVRRTGEEVGEALEDLLGDFLSWRGRMP